MQEIVESKYKSYGFTYRKLSSPELAEKHHYAHILTMLGRIDPNFDFVIEEDPIVHIHGVITLPKNYHRKKLIVHDYSMKLEELYNEFGWRLYLLKQQSSTDQDLGGNPQISDLSSTKENSPTIPRCTKNIMVRKK